MQDPPANVIKEWKDTIRTRGSKRIKARTLLKAFGVKKRGRLVPDEIAARLKKHKLFVDGLKEAPDLDTRVEITKIKIMRVGERTWTGRERKLKDDFGISLIDQALAMMGRKRRGTPNREHPGHGSRDKYDYLCVDRAGNPIVIEIKTEEGDRRGVEQVLRYIGQLKRDPAFKGKNPEGVLVTGKGDLPTRSALIGLDRDGKVRWFVYGMVGEGKRTRIVVEENVIPRR